MKLAHTLERKRTPLCLARVHAPVMDMAKRAGLIDAVGADRVFPTIEAAVAWAEGRAARPPATPQCSCYIAIEPKNRAQ